MMSLIRDSKDGKLSHSKIGVLIAGFIFSMKMAGIDKALGLSMPDDWLLWTVFMSTVGGYAVLLKLVASKFT